MADVARPPGNKSVLFTPDPYHVPGYGGFCAQFKYQIGETFGRTTSRLLRDDTIASSGRLVLTNIDPDKPGAADKCTRAELIRTRTQSWGDHKLMEKMVPGYTGFIPKNQHYFGKRYADNCVNAISSFEGDQRAHGLKINDLRRTIGDLQTGKLAHKDAEGLPRMPLCRKTPLQPIASKAEPYIPKRVLHHSVSPYFMKNTNQEKRYMSGYTGFVPRSRGLLGSGYPIITNVALNEFTDAIKLHEALASQPIQIHRPEAAPVNSKPIYPEESGLVPHYTGHIPGEKFRYGSTFGHSTKNANAR